MMHLVNLLDSESLDDVTGYTKTEHVTWTDEPYRIDFASRGEIEHASTWQGPNFDYYFNKFGFRFPDKIPDNIDIGAFGCSFTAGLGLPEDYLWHNLVASELQLTSLNFGVSGASVKSIAELFLITSKHIQMKHAVFLLPSYNRMQIGIKHMKKDMLTHLSLIPGLKSELSFSYGVDVEMLYKHIPDDDQIKTFKNDMYLLDYVAKNRNIKVYFSSWDGVTYNLLNQLNLKNSTILPLWSSKSKEQAESDLARDKKHPGPIHHTQWANVVREFIK
jgi:hypothetical protein